MEIARPNIFHGRTNLDFGQGFYVTTLQTQAEKWAKRKAVFNNGQPCVNIYDFDSTGLNILRFEGYTEEWLDFVVTNRARASTHTDFVYDAVFGNIADDDVATVIDEYLRLLEMNRVNQDVKKATLYQLTFSKPNNQYCIATQNAANNLYFIKSYLLEE
jgi:hypothetical protein